MRHARIRSWLPVAAVLLTLACWALRPAPAAEPARQTKVGGTAAELATSKEILLLYGEGKADAARAAATEAGLEVVEDYEPGRFLRCKPGADVRSAAAAAAQVAASDAVLRVEPDFALSIPTPPVPAGPEEAAAAQAAADDAARRAQSEASAQVLNPNDPEFVKGNLWGMLNIRGPAAWATIHDARPEIVVAVIDTGVDYTHPDLKTNLWTNPGETPGDGIDNDRNGIVDDVYGAKFNNGAGTGDPKDDHGHGTHCAGTIGAIGNNGIGVVGVNWKVRIMALKFLQANGSGSTSDAVRCIDYAIAKGVKVMSNSWSGGGASQALADAITRAEKAGILFVAAASNNNTDNDVILRYPCNYPNPNIISVMAITPQETKAGYSNWGKTTVDIGAPGGVGTANHDRKSDILSTLPNNKYEAWAGTSMATPHVAGAAALVWSYAPNNGKSALQIKDLLLANARRLPALTGKCVTGGTLDLSFLGNGKDVFVVGNSTDLALGGGFTLTDRTGRADYVINGAHFTTRLNLEGPGVTSDGYRGVVYTEERPDRTPAYDFLFTEKTIGNVLYYRVYVRQAASDKPFEHWFADTTVAKPTTAARGSSIKADFLRNGGRTPTAAASAPEPEAKAAR